MEVRVRRYSGRAKNENGQAPKKIDPPMTASELLEAIERIVKQAVADAIKAHFTVKAATSNAERQRRFRERKRNAMSNATVTLRKREKRNGDSNGSVTPLNGEAVAYIPIIGGKEFGVSKEYLTELEAAYPLVDGLATLKEIRVWCISNPSKQKTARGATRFINGWFERLQNRG